MHIRGTYNSLLDILSQGQNQLLFHSSDHPSKKHNQSFALSFSSDLICVFLLLHAVSKKTDLKFAMHFSPISFSSTLLNAPSRPSWF